jgi:hypothetical protein
MNYLTDILGAFLDFVRLAATGIVHAPTGTAATTSGDATVTGTGTKFLTELKVGDSLTIGAVTGTVLTLTSDTELELAATAGSSVSTVAFTATGVARSTLRPTNLDANFGKIADVEDLTYTPKLEKEEVMKPRTTGGYGRKANIVKRGDVDITATVNDVTELLLELVTLSSAAISTTFTPAAGDGSVTGWFRLRFRNQDGDIVMTNIVYAEMSCEPLQFGNQVPKPKITLSILAAGDASGGANYGLAALDA